MIKFFRKIRFELLNKNKTGKYFKYAIGEIVLVVIGILIALSINNWNENRKITNIEIEYLQRLRSDLLNDMAYYQRRIKYADKVIDDHKNAFLIAHTEIEGPRDFYQSFKNLVWSSEALSLRDITYNEMLNAGQLKIISNDVIKTKIMEFYSQVDLVEKHFEEINSTSIEYMSNFFIQSYSLKHFWSYENEISAWTEEMLDGSNDWSWINNPESESFKAFLFSLEFYSNKQQYFKNYFIDLEGKSAILINDIEKEMELRNIEVSEIKIEPIFVID